MDDLISNLTRCCANEGMRIGDAIKRERKKAGLTQGELADRLDVTQSLIGQYERGVRNPKPSTIQRIADALGIHSASLTPVSSAQPETHDKRAETHGVCLDAISRQDAIEAVQNRHMMLSKEKVLLINDLKKLPPAEPKRGKWIYHIDELFPAESTMECNQCHAEQPLICDDEFCPKCGAKMEGTT